MQEIIEKSLSLRFVWYPRASFMRPLYSLRHWRLWAIPKCGFTHYELTRGPSGYATDVPIWSFSWGPLSLTYYAQV